VTTARTTKAAAWVVRVKRGARVGDLFKIDDLYVFQPADGSRSASCSYRHGPGPIFDLVARIVGRPRDELVFEYRAGRRRCDGWRP
jgi:hypothetical protein